jgi:hypothetical protein
MASLLVTASLLLLAQVLPVPMDCRLFQLLCGEHSAHQY